MELNGNIVYKATNIITKKVYIGTSKHKLEVRRNWHLQDIGRKRIKYVFHKALKKHGYENFHWEILRKGLTESTAYRFEKFYIKKYGSLIPNGYNMTEGGKVPGKLTAESEKLRSENLSKKLKGRIFTQEHKNSLSKAMRGSVAVREARKVQGKKLSRKWKNNPTEKMLSAMEKSSILFKEMWTNPTPNVLEGIKKRGKAYSLRAKNPTKKMIEGNKKISVSRKKAWESPTDNMLAGLEKIKLGRLNPNEKMKEGYKKAGKTFSEMWKNNPTPAMIEGQKKSGLTYKELCKNPTEQMKEGYKKISEGLKAYNKNNPEKVALRAKKAGETNSLRLKKLWAENPEKMRARFKFKKEGKDAGTISE